MQNTIGETICQYRQLRKLSQEEFASRIGVTAQAVSKWERGNYKNRKAHANFTD